MTDTPAEFTGCRYGINTVDPAQILRDGEAAELLNFRILNDGAMVPRPPITQYTNSAAGTGLQTAENIPISGTTRTILVDDDQKIYYLDGSYDPQLITGTLSGAAQLFAFDGKAVICDTSYLKYLDGVTAVKIAYDNGTGTSAYQFYNRTGTNDTTTALGNGTNTRVAYKFSSQSFDSGYTIPPTTLYAYLTKTGSPTGSIVMKIRLVSDDSVLATKTFLSDVSTLTGTAVEYYATFASTDITTEMSPSIAYYASLEYSGGDGSNYVNVHCTTVASGGTGYHYAGSWSQDATKDPIMGLKPGRPPKASFGCVFKGRPFVSGDPDNTGYVWFGNRTILDWSTTDYAGYIGSVDDNANNYAVGAIQELYGELYVFGKEDQPYICKLTGDTPADYSLPVTFQRFWSTHRTCVNTGNDIWLSSSDAVTAISGVQEYGDLRVNPYSRSIENKISDNWSTSTAVAGYYPQTGQYMLHMPTSPRIFVCHTKAPTEDPSGVGVKYPWSTYELYKYILTSATYQFTAASESGAYYVELSGGGDPSIGTEPDYLIMDGKLLVKGTALSLYDHEWYYGDNDSLGFNTIYVRDESGNPNDTGVEIRTVISPKHFSVWGGVMYICASDGHLYKIDITEYKDMTTNHIRFDWRGRFLQAGVIRTTLKKQMVLISGNMGAQLDLQIFKDDIQRDYVKTYTYMLPINDQLDVNDMTGDVDDAYFLVEPDQKPTYKNMRLTCWSFQPRVTNVYLSGAPIVFRGIYFIHGRD